MGSSAAAGIECSSVTAVFVANRYVPGLWQVGLRRPCFNFSERHLIIPLGASGHDSLDLVGLRIAAREADFPVLDPLERLSHLRRDGFALIWSVAPSIEVIDQ